MDIVATFVYTSIVWKYYEKALKISPKYKLAVFSKIKFRTHYLQRIKIEEAVMMSSFFFAIIILSGHHYRHIGSLSRSTLNQSNGSILSKYDVVKQWRGIMLLFTLVEF